MSKSIPTGNKDQFELNANNEIWTLASGGTLTSLTGHGVHESAQYHDNLVQIDGKIIALSNASAGVAIQGIGSSVYVSDSGAVDGWAGIELFNDQQSGVNDGILNVTGVGMFSDGEGSFLTNNGIIKVHSSASADVDGMVASGETEVMNGPGGSIDVTGTGITIKSFTDQVTTVTNFGSVMGGNFAFYGWGGNETLVNRGFMNGDVQLGGGKDTFDGVGGTAQGAVMGGYGDDIYKIDTANIFLFEKTGEGLDTVESKVSWTLAKDFEDLKLTGSSAISGKGNELANILTGNSKANTLRGMDGEDDLDGGKGADILLGGRNADTFHFSTGYGKDTITDFTNGIDTIDLTNLSGVTDFFDLKKNHMTVSGDDLIITSGVDKLIIEDTKKSEMDFFDFNF
jgi:Ca2+-binding RTX toxin-like protein